MEKTLKERIKEIYLPFSTHQQVNKKELFALYNELTNSNMPETNCAICLIKIKNAFEAYLAENQ